MSAQPLAELFDHARRPASCPVQTIGLPSTAVQLAADAGLVAIVPLFSAARLLREGRLRELPLRLTDWTIEVRFVYQSTAAKRPGVAALLANLPAISKALTPPANDG